MLLRFCIRASRVASITLGLAGFLSFSAFASSGTEGASFLDIPVGARPAALGSAYSALASDAYAPTWNPGALGGVDSSQLAGQHLAYLNSINYEYLSYVHPFENHRALGLATQYLGSGDIAGTDISGNPTGNFSARYGAYTIAYGQSVSRWLSLGASFKIINAKISDVSATAFAGDLGSYWTASRHVRFAGVVSNIGTPLTFLQDGDKLPLAFRISGAYTSSHWTAVMEGEYPSYGLASLHVGVETNPSALFSLRLGYRTDTVKGLSPMAGLTMGFGLCLLGQEFSYAWLPLGDLGSTQYFSLVLRWGRPAKDSDNRLDVPLKNKP